MKKFLIAILLALPMTISAQDNTWERIEVEPRVPHRHQGTWQKCRRDLQHPVEAIGEDGAGA